MSILVKAYYSLLADVSNLTGVSLSLPNDLEMSWVQITGPALDKQLTQYLEGIRDEIPDFPDWLMPLWKHFESNTKGFEVTLRCLRTLLVFGYKAEIAPTTNQLSEVQSLFEQTQRDVAFWNSWFNSRSQSAIYREARRLVGSIIYRIDWQSILPSHGPGAVFPRKDPKDKGNASIYAPIASYYPYDRHFNALTGVGFEPSSGTPDLLSDYVAQDSILCNMVAVPKDSRGPRLICVHPSEAIWIQQGQRHLLESAIERHPLTSGRVNFTDQRVNGSLSLLASFDQSYTTIDLKEASDRIGKALTDYLFGGSACYINSSRASQCRLLDGRLIDVHCFAPMGNCLTFPVESLVHWSLVRSGILMRHGSNCDDVYVFGDDIIVPTKYYEGAIYGLVSAGLIPNVSKTFRKGFFRESCGVDAYLGKDVTPLRCKVGDLRSYSNGESVCDLAKRCLIQGFANTSSYLYSRVAARFGRLSLTNNPNCQGLIEYCRYDFGNILRYESRACFCKHTHTWRVPYRKRVRTLEVITNHAWWHVQESILSLLRKEAGARPSPFSDEPSYTDRGLEYPTPRGERLERGFSELLLN